MSLSEEEAYRFITNSAEAVYKEKGSRFLAYAYPVKNEAAINTKLEVLKKLHHKARHHCYAYRILNDGQTLYRANDAGEPVNSAGIPILNQIEKEELINILIIVVRYFGGTKLGIGGLQKAYKTATAEVLKLVNTKAFIQTENYKININYEQLSRFKQICSLTNTEVREQNFEAKCYFNIDVPVANSDQFEKACKEQQLEFIKRP